MACFASNNQATIPTFDYVLWVETVFDFRNTKNGKEGRVVEICFKKIGLD